MKQKRKSYSRDYKLRLVEICKAKGNVESVSREYGISGNTLHRWIKEFKDYSTGSFPGRGKPKLTEEEARMRALQKELREVTMERDILKKAVHIFSRSDGESTNS